ncbi:kinase-like protein [Polyplosphaeria fusca]|uniref:non-specific serine/threonine protein kinase n=1 Tax=Polyplosphaeria fusca TaxID=682080 RepID=A0A9P4V4F9_9PLEO|nr:kinase-like protein [Polyplosphaeria fusca]
MSDRARVDLPPEEDASDQGLRRNSPASAVCYLGAAHDCPGGGSRDVGDARSSWRAEDGESTPRSEVPSSLENANAALCQVQNTEDEPGYFSPRPLRLYGAKLPSSTDPSPTSSLNVSTASMHSPKPPLSAPPTEQSHLLHGETPGRPSVQRDHSAASTASAATVRAHTVDPIQSFTPPSRPHRDGPQYPNQSYAALHHQHHPPSYSPHILRTRSSHPSHYTSHSITTAALARDAHRDIMDSGSRTVGNSPATSPGLFSPTTPPLRHVDSDEQGFYSSPYLHHTQRQAPKETHVADVDFDPVSGRKVVNQYEVIDELGRGVHGKVKLGRDLGTGQFVAIKIVDRFSKRRRLGKNTSHEDKIKKEIAILKKARHPNIVSLLEVIDDPKRRKVYIVLEHVELGEVKWRAQGAKEIALIEWRRYEREREGIFDNDSARMEDERILRLAHQRLTRHQRRQRERGETQRQNQANGAAVHEPWSFEHGGDSSEDEAYDEWRNSRTSNTRENRPPSRRQLVGRVDETARAESTMETAYRSTTPTVPFRQEDSTGLEGTMYGAYDTDLYRGRTPSVTESSSSHLTDEVDQVPEHFRYVPVMTISAAREAFRDTVLGLEYLHYQGVIHRDIKPANLLQTKEYRVKISDFGVSYVGRTHSDESNGDQSESDYPDADEAIELAKTVGTPAFYAPELCHTDLDGETPPVTGKIDVWALGITLYCLIYGRVPFHDHNPFALMKIITDTEPYIPMYRLKPLGEQSKSRSDSHGEFYHAMTSSRRAELDLDYEQLDTNLRDLLQKLLIKDPRQRISIPEIKRHAWLLQGIDNSTSWAEDTDPGRLSEGGKITISEDDVKKAVVPFTLITHLTKGWRKTVDTVTALTRGNSRRRAQSSATSLDQPQTISAHSSSSTISQDSRRPSVAQLNQTIFETFGRAREPEHPLSQSQTASPETTERPNFFDRTASPAHSVEGNEHPAPLSRSIRPQLSERAQSTMSSAASIRTIRQSDILHAGQPLSPVLPPALPGTPAALDTPGGSGLGGIFGGMPRKLLNNMRSREHMKPPQDHLRAKSIDRLVGTNDDPHGGPSIALSNAFAAGHVDQPDLRELSPSVGRGPSPHFSNLHSPNVRERASSRQSSTSSASSYNNRMYSHQSSLGAGTAYDVNRTALSPPLRETSEDRFNRAKSEFVRQRVREEIRGRQRPRSLGFQPPIPDLNQKECPPSPDDDIYYQRQKIEDFLNEQHQGYSIDTNHFTSMSQSASNPSIPSVVSANSSVAPDDCFRSNALQRVAPIPSGESINQFDYPSEDPAGYDGDHALESGEDDDSDDDDDDFIVMGKKPKPKEPKRSDSISNAELARADVRREMLADRRRSTRSGSNGTVKKIRPHENSDDEKNKERAS